MSIWARIIKFFKKRKTANAKTVTTSVVRFNYSVTPEKVAGVMKTVTKQNKIKHNPKLQHNKKKSQKKNWDKWRT